MRGYMTAIFNNSKNIKCIYLLIDSLLQDVCSTNITNHKYKVNNVIVNFFDNLQFLLSIVTFLFCTR